MQLPPEKKLCPYESHPYESHIVQRIQPWVLRAPPLPLSDHALTCMNCTVRLINDLINNLHKVVFDGKNST